MWTEIQLNVLSTQCLDRRIDDINVVRREVEAWQAIPRQQERTRQLAVHHTRRTDQARSALSDIRRVTGH